MSETGEFKASEEQVQMARATHLNLEQDVKKLFETMRELGLPAFIGQMDGYKISVEKIGDGLLS